MAVEFFGSQKKLVAFVGFVTRNSEVIKQITATRSRIFVVKLHLDSSIKTLRFHAKAFHSKIPTSRHLKTKDIDDRNEL